MKLTGAQIVIECLVEQSVDTIFGYPGGTVLNIYDELFKNKHRIKHILTSHEQGAAHAADGYARATGKTGVCIATSGPGATNLVTGIATAYMDSVPVVFITGNVNVDLIGRDSFQEADITGITMPITKNNYIVKDVSCLAETLRKAFAVAGEGRPGPVLVDIPKNVTSEKAEFVPNEPEDQNQRLMNHCVKNICGERINKLANMINESPKTFILCGGGVLKSSATDAVLTLAKLLKAPVGVTLMGIGGYPYSDPNFTGLVGMHGTKASNIAISECELFIALGSRFNDRVVGDINRFCKNAQIVQIDIDEAEINKNVKTNHYILGDIHQVLTRLLPLIKLPEESMKPREKWLERIESLKAPNDDTIIDEQCNITPKAIISSIYEHSPQNTIIVTDVGQHQLWAAKYYRYDKPRTFISSGGFGTMGYGTGAAIGSKLGRPEMTVIHIAGDGSFRMNCNELATVEHYNLPIITVVFNNRVLGMVRQWQTIFYEKRYSNTDLDRGPDFVKLAEAYGIKGYDIKTAGEFNKAFCEALQSKKPAVLNCHIGIDEKVTPMVAPGKPITDFILSD